MTFTYQAAHETQHDHTTCTHCHRHSRQWVTQGLHLDVDDPATSPDTLRPLCTRTPTPTKGTHKMAGSYNHAVSNLGHLRNHQNMTIATENQGDAYETIEEMYGMIWWLAQGDADLVERARQSWKDGIAMSPGREDEDA